MFKFVVQFLDLQYKRLRCEYFFAEVRVYLVKGCKILKVK